VIRIDSVDVHACRMRPLEQQHGDVFMSTAHTDVGVIIPVYNRPQLVVDALDAVSRQTLRPRGLLVVDDGSEDDTAAHVAAWIAAHPEFDAHLMSLPHGGVSNARAMGIARLAELPLLALLDSDDLWPDDFLARAVSALAQQEAAVAVSTDRLHQRAGKAPKRHSLEDIAVDPVRWMIRHGAGIASCSVFRTKALLAVDAFKQDILSGEDSHAFLRLTRLGDWLYVPGEPVLFRQGGEGQEGQLSQKYSNSRFIWAEIFDEFVRDYSAPTSAMQQDWKHALAHRWAAAERWYLKRGDPATAMRCHRRALEIWPAMPRSLLRRLKAVWLTRPWLPQS
jgi:glycosyltransferase involved in cell wall biosynthesis